MIHELHHASLRRAAAPVGALALGLALAMMLPAPLWSRGIAGYAPLHMALEVVAIVVAVMVFATAWSAVRRQGRPDAVWLGAAFLGVALLDLMHALSYPGMPAFFSPNSAEKAIDFWLVARTLAALALLTIVFRPVRWPASMPWRFAALAIVLALVGVVAGVVVWQPQLFPRTFVPGAGLTAFKIGWEYTLVAANVVVAATLLVRARAAQPYDVATLFVAACAMAMSEFFFTLYADATDLYNLLGHAYKVIGYLYLFRAVFLENVERPYRELAAAEDRLRSTLETIPDLLWLKDADGVYLDCNPTFERLYGASRADIVGRTDADFVSIELAAFFRHHDRKAMEAGVPSRNEEWLTFASDGYRGLFETVKTPMRDRAGRLVGVLGIARDITERRQAEHQRQSLEAQLREAQKMESLGTLAGGIAHDFNNVLGAIVGHLALARRPLPADHPSQASLAQIGRSAERARELVQQILAFSRRQPTRKVDQPLRPLVEEAVAMLRATLPARVHLQAVLSDAPIGVRADATQIQQVLMNLCTNAWHALRDGAGDIEVGLEALEALEADAGAPRLSGPSLAGPLAHLWVRDTGVGMDEATRARVFEPFFTTKAIGQGTGLGLAVVHGIVTDHGGVVRIDSAPGRGSTFHLYLPTTPAPDADGLAAVAPTALPAPAWTAHRGHGRHVLVVDDDDVMRTMVEQVLQLLGWRVTGCRRATEALKTFQSAPQAVDAVVTDYNMPDGSGLELATALAALRPGLPVIVSSGYLSEELLAGVEAAGVYRVLPKQDTLDELPGLLTEALGA